MGQTKATMDEMVSEVMRYAIEHYEQGWDEVVEAWDDEDIINEIVDDGVGLSFGPDTLAEARNRGYTLATPGARRRRHRKPRA